MSYITVDLEWNQYARRRGAKGPVPGLEGEIIQLGAVRLDDQLNIQDKFKVNIAPVHYRAMHYKVAELTGIHSGQLASGCSFPEAVSRFRDWCGGGAVFLTWGYDDERVMRQNLALHQIDDGWLGRWYNLQLIFNDQTDKAKNQKSLRTAVDFFQIQADRDAHDALNDAYYTAEVCGRLDVARGIAIYDQLLPGKNKTPGAGRIKSRRAGRAAAGDRPPGSEAQLPPAGRTAYPPFSVRAEALQNAREVSQLCPHCQRELEMDRWIEERPYGKTFMNLVNCPEHGLFFARLKLLRRGGDGWQAVTLLYPADSHFYRRYQRRNRKTRFAFTPAEPAAAPAEAASSAGGAALAR